MQKRTSKKKKLFLQKFYEKRTYTIKEKYNSQKSNDKQNICKNIRENMHVVKYENP